MQKKYMENAQKLHQEFVTLGGMRHKLKNQMLAILPEIYKSGIYKKYAGSIVEYAGKFGDIAKTTVIKRLRLEKNLEDKPYLKAVIGKVGVHKVAMVAKIATAETDKSFAENISNMSRMAVKIEMDEESTFFLMKLKAKLGRHLSDRDFLKLMLKERVEQEFANELPRKSAEKSVIDDTIGRYIPIAKKRFVLAQTSGKCAYPNCNFPAQIFHHRVRYSQSKSHESVVPLCRTHHEFAHNNLIQNETLPAEKWQLSVTKPPAFQIPQSEILYKKYRQKALA